MFERLRAVVADTVTEVAGHRQLTKEIRQAVASGDQEAAQAFRTGTAAAALTARGRDARGQEVVDYVQAVKRADGGSAARAGWLHRR
ncbi:hypothetical protein ABT093_24190 [Kitasatospora sp. NPDC002551]|uniref:hypothetical protein n=1 Tax=Kitasatospora sp. NPDC002551 TaxID=3154539 RepID=UPI003327104B